MKLVFENNAEKAEVTKLVTDASSATNSRSLMDLVRDGEVDGSKPEPKVAEDAQKKNQSNFESMEDLVNRAKELGVVVGPEDSRAGILQKIEAVVKGSKIKKVDEDSEKKEEKTDEEKTEKSERKTRTSRR